MFSPSSPPPPGASEDGGSQTTEEKVRAAPRQRRSRTRRDPPPIVTEEKTKASTEDSGAIGPGQVEEAFAQILSLPAIAYKAPTPWHCDWCASHFARQGPIFAHDLVENRANYPPLYAAMEKIAGAWLAFHVMPAAIEYVAPPVIHHGPEVLQPIGPLFGVPERPVKEPEPTEMQRHEHTSASEGTIPSSSIPPTA